MSGSVATTNRDIARVLGAASSDSSGPWVDDAALRPAIPCKLQKTGSRLPRTFVSSPVQQTTDRLATVRAHSMLGYENLLRQLPPPSVLADSDGVPSASARALRSA